MTLVLWDIAEAIVCIVPNHNFMLWASDCYISTVPAPSSFLNGSSATLFLFLSHILCLGREMSNLFP